MMRIYLVLLALFALGVAAVAAMAQDSGYVLVEIRHWAFESSVPGALLAVLILYVLLWLLLRVLTLSFGLPARVRRALRRRRAQRATEAFEAGLLCLFEGDWSRAEAELVRRAADHVSPHLNYIAAARAAQRLGAPERRDHYLDLALRNDPSVEKAVLRTRAELALRSGDHATARTAAHSLRERAPTQAYAIELLGESLAGEAAWDALSALLVETRELGAPAPARRRAWQLAATRAQIDAAVAESRLERLKAIWDSAAAVQDDAALRRHYVAALVRLNAQTDAAAQIAIALTRDWDAGLVVLYGELGGLEPVAALASIEQWLGRYGERGELLWVAGRACLRARLWGKARAYLDGALRLAPNAAVWLTMAQLCEQTQNADEAAASYRKGLELAVAQQAASRD